jgi:addiction module HigA family antidote
MRNKSRRPTHPGELLREETLPAAGITQSELATRLGVSRHAVNDLIHERRPVNPDLAHRLARVFDTTPEFWLRLQEAVEVWETLQVNRAKYEQLKPLRERAA